MPLLARHLTSALNTYRETFRLVILGGARQTGKTTLVREQLGLPQQARLSFDQSATLALAREDPDGFVNGLPGPVAVDEFQRAGEGFLLAIKHRVDRDNTRGQFLLTGSANYLAGRGTTETLAGRAGRAVLWPLSMGERLGIRESFLDRLFEPASWPPRPRPVARADLVDAILLGGFPEVVTLGLTGRRRHLWFTGYVADVVSREALRPMAEIRLDGELRNLLRLLAARTSAELVISDLANDAQLSRATTSNYVSLLEALYLAVQIPAWSRSVTNQVKRRPKVIVTDTGLAADLCTVRESDFAVTADGRSAGALFETFVTTELLKQASWSERTVDVFHFRDRSGPEVDLILEDRHTGQVAAVEIKLTATPLTRQVRHLAMLRDRLGDSFTTGVLLHAGSHSLPFGPRLWAVPVSALWHDG
jgi:predicted AAA+ superfamily ATPase